MKKLRFAECSLLNDLWVLPSHIAPVTKIRYSRVDDRSCTGGREQVDERQYVHIYLKKKDRTTLSTHQVCLSIEKLTTLEWEN